LARASRLWHVHGVARETVPEHPESITWIDRALGLLATALPFGVALARAASSGQWRDDLPAVRDLGLVAVGVGGGLSTLVTQALCLVPLGPRSFRAAFGGALALAISARLLYGLVRRVLVEASMSTPRRGAVATARWPRLAAALAAIAALTTALSPTWQREGTVGGGAMLATAVTLAALTIALGLAESGPSVPPSRWIALGALTGAAFAESPPAGLAVLAAAASLVLVRRFGHTGAPDLRLPSPRILGLAAISALFVGTLLLAPLALRPLAPRTWIDVGRALSAVSLSAFDTASARTTALGAWTHEVGLASLGLAAFGAATALLRGRTRALIAPFLAWIVLDTLLPARAAGVLSADPLTALRSLAVAAIAVGSALGVHAATVRLLESKIPLSRAAATLVVVFHLTLVALTSEEAGFAADRSEQLAAETWTDEAFGRLEPRSAVLVRSPAIAWRLWAARIVRGERPDVVVVPVHLLDKGRVASSLAAADRGLEPLLRDFALTNEPSEFSLSKVADVRPLYVEFDAAWRPRLSTHLLISGLWLRYAPQPLGPSDRKQSVPLAEVPLRRVLAAIAATTLPDAPTSAVMQSTLRAHATVLGSFGDREASEGFLGKIDELAARDPFATRVTLPYALKGLKRAALRRREGQAPKPRAGGS
jgi:hypothetical protein